MKNSFILACTALLLTPIAVRAQESIAVARDLYAAANYDEALVVLSRLDSPTSHLSDRLAIDQYRAFCLIALGRNAEAERAIEAIVTADPLYRPADADASPRLRSAFGAVRQRILPAVVLLEYGRAKAAFDRQEFAVATAEFDKVLRALADPDLGVAAGRPPLADLQTLATGFRELSARAVDPAPVQPAPPNPPAGPGMVAASSAHAVKLIYDGTDAGVVRPLTLRQEMPPFSRQSGPLTGRTGVLELVVSEAGDVESAAMRSSIDPRYDKLVLTAAKAWKYQPATVDGTPVKYRKVINISLKPMS